MGALYRVIDRVEWRHGSPEFKSVMTFVTGYDRTAILAEFNATSRVTKPVAAQQAAQNCRAALAVQRT
jgi:DNA-binding LytR/AlgR family response regulator